MDLFNIILGSILLIVFIYFASTKRFYSIICRFSILLIYLGINSLISSVLIQTVFAASMAKVELNIFNLIICSIILVYLTHLLLLTFTIFPTLLKKYWDNWWFVSNINFHELDSFKRMLLNRFFNEEHSYSNNVKNINNNTMVLIDEFDPFFEKSKSSLKIPYYHNLWLIRGIKKDRKMLTDHEVQQFLASKEDVFLKFCEKHQLFIWSMLMGITGIYSMLHMITNEKMGYYTPIYCFFVSSGCIVFVLLLSIISRCLNIVYYNLRNVLFNEGERIKKIMFSLNLLLFITVIVVWFFTHTFKNTYVGIFIALFFSFLIFPLTSTLSSFTSSWNRVKILILDVIIFLVFAFFFKFIANASHTGGFVLQEGNSIQSAIQLQNECNLKFKPLKEYPIDESSKYSFCDTEVIPGSNLTRTDMLVFAKLAYQPYAFPFYRKFHNYDFINERTRITNNVAGYHNVYHSKKLGLTIINVRGTLLSTDMTVDSQMFTEALLVQMIQEAIPFGQLIPKSFKSLIMLVLQFSSEYLVFDEVDYFQSLKNELASVIHKAKALGNDIYFVGHSLGGSLANLLAAYYGANSITISPVGTLLTGLRYDITEEAMMFACESFLPKNDPVPLVDTSAGTTHSFRCSPDGKDPLNCHRLDKNFLELGKHCANQDLYDFAMFIKQNNLPARSFMDCTYSLTQLKQGQHL
eukprot:TRINITY_DN3311_c2_g5_i1.p1 TRINITY_DN3311_c2_g5~~TRINITY_DN3311_c2_g5_i1.p1  ORF type:complete len:691 (+),score=135.10 TRINITY_DN3311_c2_g5_i1:55-2127(+)